MPTDDNFNADTDVSEEAHQDQDDTQNDSQESHSDDSKNDFDARRAFDKTNEKINKIAKTLEKLSAEKPADEEPEVKHEDGGPDVEAIVERTVWKKDNAERISAVQDDYDTYKSQGVKEELALRLAEQDNGMNEVSKDSTVRQTKVSSASGSIKRDSEPEIKLTPEQRERGLTPEIIKKYKSEIQAV